MTGAQFIHSFGHFYSAPSSPRSSTTQRRSRLQHGYCIGVSRRSAQATVGKGLAQDPYVAARAGVEPTTLRLKVIVSTKAPPRPSLLLHLMLPQYKSHLLTNYLHENGIQQKVQNSNKSVTRKCFNCLMLKREHFECKQ